MGDKRGAGKVFQRNMGWAWGGGSPHIIGFVVDGNDGRVVFPIRRQHENTVRPGAVCGGVAGQVGATNNGGAVGDGLLGGLPGGGLVTGHKTSPETIY